MRFRITAVPAPEEDLTLSVSVTETAPTRTPDALPTSVTIPASTGGWLLGLTTTHDPVGQRAGTVTVTLTGVASGPARYRIGSPDSATVTVTDVDDLPTATIGLPASVSENEILPITVHMTPALAADQTDQTVRVVVIDSGLNHSVSKLYSVTFGAGAGSQTVTMHTVITGHGAATGRIAVELASAPADAPYVLAQLEHRGDEQVSGMIQAKRSVWKGATEGRCSYKQYGIIY